MYFWHCNLIFLRVTVGAPPFSRLLIFAIGQWGSGEYTSRRLWHWRVLAKKQRWDAVPDAIAAKISQLPNCLRRKVPGLKPKGPNPDSYDLPKELESRLEEQIQGLASGENGVMPRSEHVTKKCLASSLEWLVQELNKEIAHQQEDVKEANEQLIQSYARGELSLEDMTANWKASPKEIKAKKMTHLAQKFCKKTSLTKQMCNTSGNYLAFDDVQMIERLVFFWKCRLLWACSNYFG